MIKNCHMMMRAFWYIAEAQVMNLDVHHIYSKCACSNALRCHMCSRLSTCRCPLLLATL